MGDMPELIRDPDEYRDAAAARRAMTGYARREDRNRIGWSRNYNVDQAKPAKVPGRQPILCRLGYHREFVATSGREGYVKFMQCRRRACSWRAIRKG